MSENTSIEMASGIDSDEPETSGDYTVYDAAQVAGRKAAKGFAFLTSAAEQAGRFIEAEFSANGDDLTLEKVTSRTGRYSTDGPAVRHLYVSHDVLETLGGESTDEGFDAPDSLGVSVAPSTQEAFEASQETPDEAEDEAESLLSDAGDDDSVDVEEEPSGDEEAEELLEDMAEAEE